MANPDPSPETRFKSGEEWRGNTSGRPPRRSLGVVIREVLDSRTIKGKPLPEGRTVRDILAEVFIAEAIKGKFSFAKEVIDRDDGKVPDRIESKNETTHHIDPALIAALRLSYGEPGDSAAVADEGDDGHGDPQLV